MVRKIQERIPEEMLLQDLEKYRRRAIELGAADARVITSDMVVIDERVRAKCAWPRCSEYGTNANCPPHVMGVDEVRKIVGRFRYGIFTRLAVAPEELAGPEAEKKKLYTRSSIKNHEIVAKIESDAFYDGYYLATGFAGGSCNVFCRNMECSALVPGQGCRHYLRGRPSMEGVGMDVFMMAARVGWDIYPIGYSMPPAEAPCGSKLGLVLVH
ncbi:MAG: DUF2284 domain-containing protein [Chloroflexi bacterium]|nr:DUF2284 domain-containing protein [Chloroflexota bacterium]